MGSCLIQHRACVISAYRIAVLSTMDFADITYSLPLSNIFSGLEPSLAVILACVPLLRPLLGRTGSEANSRATPFQASNTSRRGPKINHNQFDPLDDDTSHYRLHPLGTKHAAEVTAYSRDPTYSEGTFYSDVESRGSKEEKERERAPRLNGIKVNRAWEVSNDQR